MIAINLFIVLSLLSIVFGTIQPDFSNMIMTITTDYDIKNFTEQKVSNQLSWKHVSGVYNSTGQNCNYFSFICLCIYVLTNELFYILMSFQVVLTPPILLRFILLFSVFFLLLKRDVLLILKRQ